MAMVIRDLEQVKELIAKHDSSNWFIEHEINYDLGDYDGKIVHNNFLDLVTHLTNELQAADTEFDVVSQLKSSRQSAEQLLSQLYTVLDLPPGSESNLVASRYQSVIRNLQGREVLSFTDIRTKILLEAVKIGGDSHTSLTLLKGQFPSLNTAAAVLASFYILPRLNPELLGIDQSGFTANAKRLVASVKTSYRAAEKEANSKSLQYIATLQDETKKAKEANQKVTNESVALEEKLSASFAATSTEKFGQRDEYFERKKRQYEEYISLSKPAEYWTKRAKSMRDQAYWAGLIAFILILFTAIIGYLILTHEEAVIFSSFSSGNASGAIRASLILLTIVGFLAAAVQASLKVMFSSLHLARDSEERSYLTSFYLALIEDKGSEISPEDRTLIYQSLFSRSDSGLLKGDNGPVLPSSSITNAIRSQQ